MRLAVSRIGAELAARGAISDPDDVFFLDRGEALRGLVEPSELAGIDVAARRSLREEQVRLVPPLFVGRMNPVLRQLWGGFNRMVGAVPSDQAIVSGAPASPGRAAGPVRVIRGPAGSDTCSLAKCSSRR